jgi:hypothetical protein
VGEVTYQPRPVEPQLGVFRLGRDDQYVRSLRIQSDIGSATVKELRFIFRDGARQGVRVEQRIRQGEATSLIRLQEPRPVQEVEIVYVPEGRVTLVMRSEGAPPPPPPPPPQWVEIGCQTAGFLVDRDVIDLKTREKFDALRLRASTFDMEVNEISVRFSDGVRQVYALRTIIPSGGLSGAIDLRAQGRSVSQIELIHRSRVLSNQKGQICVEGLRKPPLRTIEGEREQ